MFCVSFVYAKPVSIDVAKKVGQAEVDYETKKSVRVNAAGKSRTTLKGYSIKQVQTLMDKVSDKVFAYVLDLQPRGHIVVSPDTDIAPVIAYSYESDFIAEDFMDNALLHLVIWDMENRLKTLPFVSQEVRNANNGLWDKYLDGSMQITSNSAVYGPLIQTSWSQGNPYNRKCPDDSVYGAKSYVGCVATAMAQIVNHFAYPSAVAFTSADNYVTDTRHMPITASTASFSGMIYPISLDTDKAALSYACGVATHMDYTGDPNKGSGTYTSWVASALVNKFGYGAAEWKSYSNADFYSTLQRNIRYGRPAEVDIRDSTNLHGHAIVADGYDTGTGKYHLNFGWGDAKLTETWYLPQIGYVSPDSVDDWSVVTGAVLNISKTAPPRPSASANYGSILLPPGQQQTFTFTVHNAGTGTGNLGGYLSLNLSSGLDIVSYSSDHDPIMQYSHKQPGEPGWDSTQQQITLSYEILDAYQTYSAGETRKIYVTVKANANAYDSQWIKYRATFNDSQNYYINDPATGGTDQQGWLVYQIDVNGGGVPSAGALLVNGNSSPSAMQVSATSNGFSGNYPVVLKNPGEQAISVSVAKSGSKSAWVSLNTPTSFSINGNSSKNFYFDINVPAGTAVGTYPIQLAFTYSGGTIYLPLNVVVTQYRPGEPATVNCTGVSSPYYVTQATPLDCYMDLSPYSDVIQNGLIPTKSKFKATLGSNNGYPYYYLEWDGDNPSYYPEPRAGFYTTVGTDIYWAMEKAVGTVFSTRINDPNTTSSNHVNIRTTMGSEYNLSNPRYEFTAYDGDPNLKINTTISNSTCLVGDIVNISLAQTNSGTSPADERVFEVPVLPAGLQYSGAIAPGCPGCFIYPVSDDPGDPDSETDSYSIKATIAGVYSIPGITINYENTTGTKNFKTSASPLTISVSGGTAIPSVSFSSATLKMGATETITVSVLDSISSANIVDAIVTGIITTPDLKTHQFYLNYNASSGKYVKEFADTLSSGTYTLQVSAERVFYTSGTITPFPTFNVVSRPETQVSLAGTSGNQGWYKSNVGVTLSASGGSASIQTYYAIDGGAQQAYSVPFVVAVNGYHYLEYWSTDTGLPDNNEIFHNTAYIFIDKSLPVSTCAALAPYNSPAFTVYWSGSDNGDSQLDSYDLQYKTGAGEWTDWITNTVLTSQTFGSAADGQIYSFRVRAKDNAGNIEAYPDAPDAFTTVDVSSPTTPDITSPTHSKDTWNASSNNPQFNCAASDAGSNVAGYNIALNRLASFAPDTSGINLTGTSTTFMNVADGIWYFHARARDNAGNWGLPTTYGQVKIDLYSPTFPSITSSKNPAKVGNTTLTIIASEQMSTLTATVAQNGKSAVSVPLTSQDSITWSGIYSVVSGYDGISTITISGNDLSGKAGSATATLLVDTVSPGKPTISSLTHPENTPTPANIAEFTWTSASDSGGSGVAGYSYALNQTETFTLDSTTETALTTYSTQLLADGIYWLHIGAVDNAGNLSETDSYKFEVDTTSPTLTAVASPNPAKAGNITITLSSNESLTGTPTVTVRQNGQGASTPITVNTTAATAWQGVYAVVEGFDGTASINVSGSDLALNTTAQTSTFQVDNVGPSAAIVLSPAAPLKTGPFTVTVTLQDASSVPQAPLISFTLADGTTMPIALTGGDKNWQGNGFIYSGVSTGTATVNFSAMDEAGNIGGTITSGGTFTVDTSVSGISGGTISNADGTTVVTPPNAYSGAMNIVILTPDSQLEKIISANNNSSIIPMASINLYRDFSAKDTNTQAAVTNFAMPVIIKIPYPDANNDGVVDGTNIREDRLTLFWLNETASTWEEIADTTPDYTQNIISANVYHFSIYSLLAYASPNLNSVRVYPVPWTPGSGDKYDSPIAGCGQGLQIDKITSKAKISIYTLQGDLVRRLTVEPADNGCKSWDGKNVSGRNVTSGVYIAVIEGTLEKKVVKKLVIER